MKVSNFVNKEKEKKQRFIIYLHKAQWAQCEEKCKNLDCV